MTTRPKTITHTRHWLQGTAVLGTFLIGLRHVIPGKTSSGGAFDAFCPFGGVETLLPYLTTGQTLKTTNPLNFAILLGVIGVSLLAGRAFCGWMCPLGTLQDSLAWASRRLSGEKRHIRGKKSAARFPVKLPQTADKWLRNAKYLVLAAILWASITAVYPPLHAICPVRAVFSFQLTTPLLWSVLIIFIVTSMLVERFWCKYLCPLGALLAITNKFAPLHIAVDQERCNKCGRCDVECPMDIINVSANTRDAECIRCLECVETCARQETITLELG
jgi:polyferredoxin